MTTQPVVPAGIFPLGVHVYREPAPDLDEVIRDLRLVKDAGLTMIKIQQSWSTDEPIRGELRVDHLERIIDAAHSLGLGVYVGLTIEQAPMWAWRENPDAFVIDSRGAAHNDPTQYTLPTDGKPGPCWHHPGMRAAAESFIERLVARLSRFENVWVWNTWQEIGFWNNDAGALGFCFCSHSLTSFRNWLQDEYTNLEGLNTAWRTAYTDWADPTIDMGDDWRKELADAGDFAPEAAKAQLRSEAALRQALCDGALEWIVVDAADVPQHPWLAEPELIAKSRRSELRHFDRHDARVARAAGCDETASPPR